MLTSLEVPIEELKTEAGAQSPLRGFSEKLHRLASLVLNNISHAIELPWEKYLSEMHEYDAPSRSEIKIVNNVHDVGSAWSTLVSCAFLAFMGLIDQDD